MDVAICLFVQDAIENVAIFVSRKAIFPVSGFLVSSPFFASLDRSGA